MSFENISELQEYLLYIKREQDQTLHRLHEQGLLLEYIRNLHQEMNEKYPEMIVRTYTKEEIDDELGGE